MAEDELNSVAYYDRNAAHFSGDTAGLEMSALYECFLLHLPPGGRILDAGCGVGRDTLAFVERGYSVVALDASAEMVRLARARVRNQAEVLQLHFEDVAWREEFDGIWACASLLHVPAADFCGVAERLTSALRPGGTFYMSFKLGVGERRAGDRLFVDHTQATLHTALIGVAVEVTEICVSADVRPCRNDESWLNAIVTRNFRPSLE